MRCQLYLFLKLLILFQVWSCSYKSMLRDPQITQVLTLNICFYKVMVSWNISPHLISKVNIGFAAECIEGWGKILKRRSSGGKAIFGSSTSRFYKPLTPSSSQYSTSQTRVLYIAGQFNLTSELGLMSQSPIFSSGAYVQIIEGS